MRDRADIQDIIGIGFFGLVISILAFVLVEVIFAQSLLDFVIGKFENNNNFTLFLILLLGFMIGLIVAIVSGLLAGEEYILRRDIVKSSIMAFITNIFLWFLYALIRIITTYPEVEINWSQIFILIPRILVYYAIYFMENVPFFFILTQISYFILFVIFLIVFKAEKK